MAEFTLATEGAPITIRVVDGPTCPQCGGAEVLLGGPVRPFKVDMGRGGWESDCTACGLWFLPDGTVTERYPVAADRAELGRGQPGG